MCRVRFSATPKEGKIMKSEKEIKARMQAIREQLKNTDLERTQIELIRLFEEYFSLQWVLG